MVLGFISGVWDGIRWLISTFLDKAPKPLKLLLFLMFLILFVSAIPFAFHLFGVHCNSDKEVVKISAFDVLTNVRLARADTEDVINITSFRPEQIGTFESAFDCVFPVCNISGEFFLEDTIECANKTILYPIRYGLFESTQCKTCNGTVDFISVQDEFSLRGYVCFGDGYRIVQGEENIWQRVWCGDESKCTPPVNYYYNYTGGTFDCLGSSCNIGGGKTGNVTSYIDALIDDANGELMYVNDDDDIDHAVGFSCTEKLDPQFTVFKIPIFDYRVWLLLYIIGGMFIFLHRIRA